MEKQFRSTQFREYLIASFFAIIAQLCTMKWYKWKQPLHTIPRNGIPIETLIETLGTKLKEFF